MRETGRRLLLSAAVAGVLAATAASGSNMGFRLERDLEFVRDGVSYYLISLPFNRAFADLWDMGANDFGQDQVVDSADVLADWYTGGDGSCDGGWECDGIISLLYFVNDPGDPNFNRWVGQTLAYNPFTSHTMSGTPFDIENATDPARGYLVQVPAGTTFPVVIHGSHDPDVTEFVMTHVPGGLNKHVLSLPYHTTYQDSIELLDSIPAPDYWNGVSILRFVNDPSHPQFNQWVGQTIAWNEFLAMKQVSGAPFPLVPGEGYMLTLFSEPPTPGGTVVVPLPHY
jgi:hypothetical protein